MLSYVTCLSPASGLSCRNKFMHRALLAIAIYVCLSLPYSQPAYSQPASSTDEQRALQVAALNTQAKTLREAGQLQQARALLEQACQLDPNRNSGGVHANLAMLLERLGDFDSAKAQYLMALQFTPNRVTLLYNIALCCAQLGHVDEANSYLNNYLSQDPNGQFSDAARRLVSQLKTVSRINDNPNDPDYFASACPKIARWPAGRPVRIFIEPGDSVRGYNPQFAQILIDSFTTWMKAINNCLTLQPASNPQQADIICYWVSDRNQFRNSAGSEGGKTNYHWVSDPYHMGEYLVDNADIGLCTINIDGTAITPAQARCLCLHEIGHALGLSGHSSNNNDVMFFATIYYRPATELTDRDKATILRLYSPYLR